MNRIFTRLIELICSERRLGRSLVCIIPLCIGCGSEGDVEQASNDAQEVTVANVEQASNGVQEVTVANVDQASNDAQEATVANSDQASDDAKEAMDANSDQGAEAAPAEELKSASWIDRLRFADISQRSIAARHQFEADLDDDSLRRLALSLKELHKLHEHCFWLTKANEKRAALAKSDAVREQIMKSLRGELWLPKGTRKRLVELESYQEPPAISKVFSTLEAADNAFLRDALSQGHFFALSISLRGMLADFAQHRQFENKLDEFFLAFPTIQLNGFPESFGERSFKVPYSKSQVATAREFWSKQPTSNDRDFRDTSASVDFPDEEEPDLFASICVSEGLQYLSDLPSVMSDEECRNYLKLADWLEEQGGGAEPLLEFPEFQGFALRSRLVEASQKNLQAIHEADAGALKIYRQQLYSKLDEDDQRRYGRRSVPENPEEELSELIGSYNLSDIGTLSMIDLGIRLNVHPTKLFRLKDALGDYPKFPMAYLRIVEQRRQAVRFRGAEFYFEEQAEFPEEELNRLTDQKE